MAKLYPPQLEGKLPAFYNTYDATNTNIIETTLKIPFGINRAVDRNSIKNLVVRIRTTSTNIDIVTNYLASQYDCDEGIAIFKFENQTDTQLFNESQYYRVQLAFIDNNDDIGYYSTIGVIKCITQPKVEIINYDDKNINMFNGTTGFLGQYTQDTRFGDSTEKEYSYIFNIYDKNNNIVATSGEKIHDITEDNLSNISKDLWKTYSTFKDGEVYYLQYTVTTINGLVISTVKYKIMEMISSPIEFTIQIHATANYDKGLIDISLQGTEEKDDNNNKYYYQQLNPYYQYSEDIIYFIQNDLDYTEFIGTEEEWQSLLKQGKIFVKIETTYYGERPQNGQFVITRSSAESNFMDWIVITRFKLSNQPPSIVHYQDTTVEQGMEYKYALQQYNVHGLYSQKQYQTDDDGNFNTTIANFDSIFLTDGERQLKVYFNPEVSSFKNTILEDKVEAIGSKYPYIVRNGIVSYKEFPLGGLISYQMDNIKSFLTEEEQLEAGILEYGIRQTSNNNSITSNATIIGYEQNIYFEPIRHNVVDPYTGKVLYTEILSVMKRKPNVIYKDLSSNINNDIINNSNISNNYGDVKKDTNLTDNNIKSERYFKLKVLEWLSNGEVKLFRSPTEGNYLIRLLNVSLTPENTLGRMLHSFSSTAYEIDDLTYENLIKYNIINEIQIINNQRQWSSIDLKAILYGTSEENLVKDADNFIQVSPLGVTIESISINNFIPGDQVKLQYDNGTESNIFVIGITGSLEINQDDRKIVGIFIKPNNIISNDYNGFNRELIYSYTTNIIDGFNTISKISIVTEPAEQFIGPKENLLTPYDLKENAYGVIDENGDIVTRIDQTTGINNIYTDLVNKDHINYNIGVIQKNSDYNNYNIKKFTTLKIEYCHIWKREVIPVFASTDVITENTLFGLTPFGNGYVNNKPIINYIQINSQTKQQQIRYALDTDNIIEKKESGDWEVTNKVNREDLEALNTQKDLQSLIDENIYYANDNTLIFEVYIFDQELNEWVPSKQNEYRYYDNFTKTWWNADVNYDPSFSFVDDNIDNDLDSNTEILTKGDNNIFLNEINSLTLYNLGNISNIRLGNGVVAEITPQIRVIDYDIEDSVYEVKQAKEEYLNAKESFFDAIGSSVVNASGREELEKQQKKLEQQISAINQKIESLGNSGPFESVSLIAQERLIEQKQKMWIRRQAQLSEILNFLTQLQIYDRLETDQTISVCKNILSTDDADSVEEYLELMHERVDKLYNPEEDTQITSNDLFSAETRDNHMLFHEYPLNTKEIDGIEYDFINKSDYVDLDYYQQQHQNNLIAIDNYNEQILEVQEQQGNLIGDYNSENYTSVDALPANTIVYYDYLIKQAEEQQETELATVNKTKVALINQLLRVDINKTMDILKNISESTSEYLVKNATALSNLLSSYRTDKNQRLFTIQNQCAIDLIKIIFNDPDVNKDNIGEQQNWGRRNSIVDIILEDNKKNLALIDDQNQDITVARLLNALSSNVFKVSLLTMLDNIKQLNADENEDKYLIKQFLLTYNYQDLNQSKIATFINIYDNYANVLKLEIEALDEQIRKLNAIASFPGDVDNSYGFYNTPDYSSLHEAFNKTVESVRDSYIDSIQQKINTLLTNNLNNLNNLFFVASNAGGNSEAFAFLDLFTNEANENQATTIKQYLNKYYPANTNELIAELIKQIKNQDALYAKKVNSLNKTINEYTAFKKNLQDEVDTLQLVIDDLEEKQAEQRKQLEFNNNQIERCELLKDVLDSKTFFQNIIINNKEIKDNADILSQYLLWVEYTQNMILAQGGQFNNSIADSQTYINWIKKFINTYEEEAFEFLHKYDSIKNDLSNGIIEGTDVNNGLESGLGTDSYFYKLNQYRLSIYKDILYILDPEANNSIYNNLMEQLESEDANIRKQGYSKLLKELTKTFIGSEEDENFTLTFGMANGNVVILEIDEEVPESVFYPSVHSLGAWSRQLGGVHGNRYIISNGWDLLRDPTNTEIDRNFEVIQDPDTGLYIQNIYNLTKDYYTIENGKTVLLFNAENLSDSDFNEKIIAYKKNNQSIFWIADYPPVSLTVHLHPFLYNTDYETFTIPDSNTMIIEPKIHNQFKNFLGRIVHYSLEDGQEYGSYYALLQQDLELFNLMGGYFSAQNTILYQETTDIIKKINERMAKSTDYLTQYQYWKTITDNCEIVLESYPEGDLSIAEKRQQLLILLNIAKEKQEYYFDLYSQEEQEIEKLTQTPELVAYVLAQRSLKTILPKIEEAQNNFNKQYVVYKARVDHYLKLLLNDVPYGIKINSDIVYSNDVIQISDTGTYNFGIAYMIEKLQEYMNRDQNLAFDTLNNITEQAKYFKILLNNHFPLLTQIKTIEKYLSENKNNYYKYDEEKQQYSLYVYSDEINWENDINNGLIYYTIYPNLVDFVNYTEYTLINDYFSYDEEETYYVLNNQNELIEYAIADKEEFINMRSKLYIKQNGGLKTFLQYIYGEGAYVNEVITNYNGTLELFDTLLAQIRGDQISMEQLNKQKIVIDQQLVELNELLEKINKTNIDVDAAIIDIKQKLAKFLYLLTVNYVQSVEGVIDAR